MIVNRIKRRTNCGNDFTLYESDKWKIIVPEDEDATVYLSNQTRWCLAAPEHLPNVFNFFKNIAPILIAIPKHPTHPKEKYSILFSPFLVPCFLLRFLHKNNALTECLRNAMLSLNFNDSEIENFILDGFETDSLQEIKIWESFYHVTGEELQKIIKLLGIENSNTHSLADLINPINLFPTNYMNLPNEFIGKDNIKVGVMKNENNEVMDLITLKKIIGNEWDNIINVYNKEFYMHTEQFKMFLRYAEK